MSYSRSGAMTARRNSSSPIAPGTTRRPCATALRYGIHLVVGRDDERASNEESAAVAAGKAVRGGDVEVVAEVPVDDGGDDEIGVVRTKTKSKTKVKRTRFALH